VVTGGRTSVNAFERTVNGSPNRVFAFAVRSLWTFEAKSRAASETTAVTLSMTKIPGGAPRLTGAPSLVRSHSHKITALGRDRFLVEHAGADLAPEDWLDADAERSEISDGYLLVSVRWNLAKGRLRPAVLPFP